MNKFHRYYKCYRIDANQILKYLSFMVFSAILVVIFLVPEKGDKELPPQYGDPAFLLTETLSPPMRIILLMDSVTRVP